LSIKNHEGKPINIGLQEDAHELLNLILDKVEKNLKANDKVNELDALFGGKTITEIICMKCSNKI
jgi:ubiquitin carboxyl-terminal hydrolase 34